MRRFIALLLCVLMEIPYPAWAGQVIKRGPHSNLLYGVTESGTGNDSTLTNLIALKEFQGLDGGQLKTRFWFDPYDGNDTTGTGTYANPFRSMAKMKVMCVSYTRCTVKGKNRVFSPLTLTMSAIAVGENYAVGEAITWDAGASAGTVLDWYPKTETLVIDFDSGTAPIAGESALTGSTSGAIGDIASAAGIKNTVGGHDVYTFAPGDVTLLTDLITILGHSYVDGEGPMRAFSSGTLPTGLALATDYYVCDVIAAVSFTLDTDPDCAGASVDINTSQGSGVHGIAGYLNSFADDVIVTDCADVNRVCVLFESEFPENPATIDGNQYHSTGYINTAATVFGAVDGGIVLVNDTEGWVGWQNINIQNIANDASSLQSAGDGKLILLNSKSFNIRNGSENRTDTTVETNNCITTHGSGVLVSLNGGNSKSITTSASGSGACLALTGTNKAIIIGDGSYESENTGSGVSPAMSITGGDIVLIGHDLLQSSNVAGNYGVGMSSPVDTVKLQMARNLILNRSSVNAGAFSIGTTADPITIRLYETTLATESYVSFLPENVNVTTDVITALGHDYVEQEGQIFIGNTLSDPPDGLTGVMYACDVVPGVSFTLDSSSTCAGASLDILDQGTGVNTLSPAFQEAIFVGALTLASSLDFVAKGLLIDNYAFWVETANETTSVQNTVQFVLEGYSDDDDIAGNDTTEWYFGGTAAATVAAARTRLVTDAAVGWTIYANNSFDSGGAGTNGTAWTTDTIGYRCAAGQLCYEAYRNEYTIDLRSIFSTDPNASCIPEDVMGARICAFSLTPTHIGAR